MINPERFGSRLSKIDARDDLTAGRGRSVRAAVDGQE